MSREQASRQTRRSTSRFPPIPRFGDLRVRPKLIVLHNLFFLVLTASVYFSLIPLVEERVASALRREESLAAEMFAQGDPLLRSSHLELYEFREGAAAELNIAPEVQAWLDRNVGQVRRENGTLYRKPPGGAQYQALQLPSGFYGALVSRVKRNLFLVLGAIYVGAVLLLELLIMPKYVYRPIRVTLDADEASRQEDRRRELIPEELTPGDEIGDIMRSRNETLARLRAQEDELEEALRRVEELAEDLGQKNRMLEAAKQSMADQDRLVSLGLLSASVAHELNTPLTVLGGSVEKLLETETGPSARNRLERIQRMTARLRAISASLLDFSRRRDGGRGEVVLRGLVDEAWSLVALHENAGRVRFVNQLGGRDRVLGDYDRLMQVFVNLLRNAVHALPEPGEIVVHSRVLGEDGGQWLAIDVDDSGAGIPEEVLPNIFEAFVSSRLDSEGTGLGLTVAEGIVTEHGGSIIATNRPEGGARLEVRLPLAAPAFPRPERGGAV